MGTRTVLRVRRLGEGASGDEVLGWCFGRRSRLWIYLEMDILLCGRRSRLVAHGRSSAVDEGGEIGCRETISRLRS